MPGPQDVVVGYLNGDYVTQQFLHCLFGLFIHDTWTSRRIANFAPQYSGVNICRARNQMVTDMLADPRAQWLLMFDTDAAFAPDTLDRMLAAAHPEERPVVGALAFQRRGRTNPDGSPAVDRLGNQEVDLVPTMYQISWNADGTYDGYREATTIGHGLQEVDATGCHCLLVHRSVFEAIKSEHPYRWFREDEWEPGGPIVGEDIWFCLKARQVGIPIFVDTRIEAGHVKHFVVTSTMSTVERV